MLQKVIRHTNKKITDFMTRFHEVLEQSSKYYYVKVTNLIEIKTLLGLLYLRAALQPNIFKARDILHENSHEIFVATIIYNHFFLLDAFPGI